MMKYALLATTAALAANGYMAKAPTPPIAPPAPPQPPVPPVAPQAPAAQTEGAKRRADIKVSSIRADVAMPVIVKAARGAKSKYDFDQLTELGHSFGVIGGTAKNLSSVVSKINRSSFSPKTDATGAIVYKTQTVPNPNDPANPFTVKTQEPEMVQTRKFQVHDVDAAGDPDGASARVWRIAVD